MCDKCNSRRLNVSVLDKVTDRFFFYIAPTNIYYNASYYLLGSGSLEDSLKANGNLAEKFQLILSMQLPLTAVQIFNCLESR